MVVDVLIPLGELVLVISLIVGGARALWQVPYLWINVLFSLAFMCIMGFLWLESVQLFQHSPFPFSLDTSNCTSLLSIVPTAPHPPTPNNLAICLHPLPVQFSFCMFTSSMHTKQMENKLLFWWDRMELKKLY